MHVIVNVFLFPIYLKQSVSVSMSMSVPIASHSRTGSSPAMMQACPPSSSTSASGAASTASISSSSGVFPPSSSSCNSGGAKAMRTHTYPKLPDKFRVRSPEQPPPDEEVIFFWRLSGKTRNFLYSLIHAKVWLATLVSND